MSTFHRILVPIDFGAHATHAVEIARSMGLETGARVTLLHVFEPPTSYGYGGELYWPTADFIREAQKALDAALLEVKATMPSAEALLVCGNPVDVILATAREHGSDLIVMGTHGRRGLSHALLGSVAEKVVRRSTVPVLTIGLPADAEAKNIDTPRATAS